MWFRYLDLIFIKNVLAKFIKIYTDTTHRSFVPTAKINLATLKQIWKTRREDL